MVDTLASQMLQTQHSTANQMLQLCRAVTAHEFSLIHLRNDCPDLVFFKYALLLLCTVNADCLLCLQCCCAMRHHVLSLAG